MITDLETIAEDNLTRDYIRDRLIHESENKSSENDKASDALYISNQDKRFKKCHNCKIPGHIARDCNKKKKDQKKKDGCAKLANNDENTNLPDEIDLNSSHNIKDSNW